MNKKNLYYSFEQINKDIRKLYLTLKGYKGIVKNIYGTEGLGLIFAVIISSMTGIPLLREKTKISSKTIVIFDKIESVKDFLKFLKGKRYFSTVAIWLSEESKYKPTIYLNIKSKQYRIKYLWEK